jgi:hypothetical protein
MDIALDEVLLRDLTLPVVTQVAPAEVELYPLLSAAYFDDPARALAGKGSTGPLAFGLPELYALVTPVALEAMKNAVQYVIGQGVVCGWRVTKRALRRLFGLDEDASVKEDLPADELVTLTVEQWAEIRALVVDVALRSGMPAGQADLLGDAVVGRGVTRTRQDRA